MKKLFTFLLLTVSLQIIKAQTYVTIPDANFVAWLQLKIPSAMSGNQMDISNPAVTNRTKVDISGENITDLTGIQYFTALDTFRCVNGYATVLPALPNSVTYIDIYSGSFANIISLPNSLKEFNCEINQLTSLPPLPASLITLTCRTNSLTSLPALPASLTFLNCEYNQITTLPTLPGSLINLICPYNSLTSLPVLPNSIIYIDCYNNQLTSLPVLPLSLTNLNCYNNQLTILPTLPSSLTNLNCSNNLLTVLSALPNSLVNLGCSANQLTGLPALPNSLITLGCSYNQLTSLPVLPSALSLLDCSHNQITNLPALPSLLQELHCSYNLLTGMPSLPVGLMILICSHNNISCFPPLPPIQVENIETEMSPILAFDISSNPFTCLPNYVPAMNNMLLSYPLCVLGDTANNPSGCIEGKGISGRVYHDLNTDCVNSTNELGIINASVKLYDNLNVFLGMTNAVGNGVYYFNVSSGDYKVVLDTLNKPYKVQCINPGIDSLVSLTTAQFEDSVNFAVTCKPGFDLAVQSIHVTGSTFPTITHTLTVWAGDMSYWNNLKCAAGISGTLSITVNGPVTYIGPAGGALTPVVNGNVYTYIISDFGTINNYSDFKLRFTTNTTAQIGDSICVSAIITPVNGDTYPSNNLYHYCYPVRNSYDPNKKEVFPVVVMPGFNDWLTYTIHFRNTGTSAAMNVRLVDTLDSFLDPETFQVTAYSHNNIVDLMDRNLIVRFPNIQLSSPIVSQQGALGFIQYRIKPKANWTNDTIKNKARIYFDYNAPIVTNTAKTYFMTVTGITEPGTLESTVKLMPNPTNGLVTITSTYEIQKVEMMNIAGQVLLSEKVNSKEDQLQLQNFAEGIYFIKCTFANGMSVTRKLIKQ
jgi:uncharacterized repeat protein (TIGR01451 family)